MGNRRDHRLGDSKREDPPALEFLFATHVIWSEALDIGPLAAGQRMIAQVEPGGRIEGPRMHGRVQFGSIALLIRSDAIVEIEGNYILEMDDGHRVRSVATGIRTLSAEYAKELADGQAFDPTLLYSRAFVRLEAADDGPYAWLNRDLYLSKSTRMADSADATVWRIL